MPMLNSYIKDHETSKCDSAVRNYRDSKATLPNNGNG